VVLQNPFRTRDRPTTDFGYNWHNRPLLQHIVFKSLAICDYFLHVSRTNPDNTDCHHGTSEVDDIGSAPEAPGGSRKVRAPRAAPLAAGSSPYGIQFADREEGLRSYYHISPSFPVPCSSSTATSGGVTMLKCLKTSDPSHSERCARVRRVARGLGRGPRPGHPGT
jgi:hypothetical protein